MDLELVVRLLAGVLLIAANAFFVAVEFALTRLRGLDLDPEEIDSSGLRTAWKLTERLEIHLTGCQLGISSTSVLLGVVAEPAFTRLVEPVVGLFGIEGPSVRAVSVVVAVVLLNLIHKVWGEQAPTYLGVEKPREVARRLSPALAVWTRVMEPVIRLGDGAAKGTLRLFGVEITRSWLESERTGKEAPEEEETASRSELMRRMAALLTGGELPEDRQEEVMQALRIDEIPARDIMIPLKDVVWLRLGDDMADHVRVIGESGLVRYPVLEADGDPEGTRRGDVAGLLYVPSLFTGEWPPPNDLDLRPRLADALYLASELPVADLIDRLQEEHQELAMLTDPDDDDRIVGVVTASDAFEVIAGELEDPLDRRQSGSSET